MRPHFGLLVVLAGLTSFADVGTRSFGLQAASGLQDRPALTTWNGVTWAAWLDTSDARYFETTRVLVSRLSANGAPVDQPGVALPFRASSALPPRLAVCGGQLWAMWESEGLNISLAPLTAGPSGVAVGAVTRFPSPSITGLSLAEGPTDCLAAWSSVSSVSGVRLPLSANAAPVVVTQAFMADLQVAHDGTRYVGIGTTSTALFGFFIDPATLQAGAVQTWATFNGSSEAARETTLAAANGTVLVGWNTSNFQQRLLWVDASGAPIAGPATIDAGVATVTWPSLVARDGGFSLLTSGQTASTRLLTLTGLSSDGGITAVPVSLPLPLAYFPQISAVALGRRGDDLVALSAFGHSSPEPLDIHAHVIGAGPVAPVVVSSSSAAQRGPFVASLGDEVLAGFTEARRPGVPDTQVQYVDLPYIARLAPSGVLRSLDPQLVAVPPATIDGSSSVVGVVATGTGWRVAWADIVRNDLWSVSVDGASGALGTPVRHFTNVKRGALAVAGTSTLVVGASTSVATAQRLDAQGAPVGSAIMLPTAFRGVAIELSVAAGAGGWLVGGINFLGSSATLVLQWIDTSGALGPSVTRTVGLPREADRGPPALAWNGSEWLVAVQNGGCSIALERFSAGLVSVDSTTLMAGCPRTVAVAPSFDGGWFIAHSEVESPGSMLHLRTFSTTLTLLDDEVIALGRDVRWPALTRIEPDTLGVAYVKLVDEAPFGTWRVRLQHWPDSRLPDAGVVDAGVVDAGVVDAGVVDAGVVDAGVVDAGVVDAGVVDAGVVDAGVVDAGVVDAGVVDAGVVDADAGVVDAGSPGGVDAGSEPPKTPSGCGCTSGGEATLLALGALALRRRRASGSSPR